MVTTEGGRCRLSLPSHLVVVGAQRELQHRFRVRAAFDAFVPGTPLY